MKNRKERLVLTADPVTCSGCRICELVCSFTHEGVFSPEQSRIRIVRVEPPALDFPIACQHCSRPICVTSCPANAIAKDDKGLVRVSEERCIGCGICVQVCPIGAIRQHPEKNTPLICDLCGECVKYCPTQTLKISRVNRIAEKNARFYCFSTDKWKQIYHRFQEINNDNGTLVEY